LFLLDDIEGGFYNFGGVNLFLLKHVAETLVKEPNFLVLG
jgi:hypothetical protein